MIPPAEDDRLYKPFPVIDDREYKTTSFAFVSMFAVMQQEDIVRTMH